MQRPYFRRLDYRGPTVLCMVHLMSVVVIVEVKHIAFFCAQKEKKVKVGRDSDRSELFGSDMTSASDEQVSSCVTLIHTYVLYTTVAQVMDVYYHVCCEQIRMLTIKISKYYQPHRFLQPCVYVTLCVCDTVCM